MYLIPFFVVDADLANRETRVVNLMEAWDGIPPGSYGLIESYCPDPACDCRRVMLNVYEERHPLQALATIGYGFDRDSPDAGPYLDPLNPQSPYAPALLRLIESATLNDPHYVARLERHYALVKQAAADPRHPAYPQLQEILAEDRRDYPRMEAPYRGDPRIRRNDPCPCGSGKKYKQCCGRR